MITYKVLDDGRVEETNTMISTRILTAEQYKKMVEGIEARHTAEEIKITEAQAILTESQAKAKAVPVEEPVEEPTEEIIK